ncbi:MAG TPA: 4'-phosphopantetheinyl transferase superfamily protein [Rhizomicrobium sp.]|nr:4'-phosphopantetheinyl transferase superfamily protein [Rhizomicrobium sp.]
MIMLLGTIHGPDLLGAELEDVGQPVPLLPAEEALVERAAPKRRREFALGRACARAALEKLGHRDWVIGRGANGAPLWPGDMIGSITHTRGYAAALLGAAQHFSGIGVDAEHVGGVSQDLWPRLFDARERDHLMALDAAAQPVAATLIFSAKEACYKAWGGVGPLVFHDIHVTPQDGGFTADRAGAYLQGRYAMEGDLMVTAAWF